MVLVVAGHDKKVKLTWEPFAQLLDWRGLLLLANLFILLLVGCGFEALPRQTPAEEVHEDVTKRLEVVSARLLCKTRQRAPVSDGRSRLR